MENKTLQEALEIPHLYEYFSNEGQNYRVEAREYYAKYYTENAELRAILGEEAWVIDALVEKIKEMRPSNQVTFMLGVEKDSIVAFNRAMRSRDKDALVRILAAQLERTGFWLAEPMKGMPSSVGALVPIPKIADTDLTPRAYMFRYFFENPEWGTRLPTSYGKMTGLMNAYLSAAPDLQESLPYYLGETPEGGCLPWDPFVENLNSVSESHDESGLCTILGNMAEYCVRDTMSSSPAAFPVPNIGARKYAAMVRGAASGNVRISDPRYCESAMRDEGYEAGLKASMEAVPWDWREKIFKKRYDAWADSHDGDPLAYLTANGFQYLAVDKRVDWFIDLVNKYREWILTDETGYFGNIDLRFPLNRVERRLLAMALSHVMLKDPDDLFDAGGELRPYCNAGNGRRINETEVEYRLKETGILTDAGVNVALVEKRLAGYE